MTQVIKNNENKVKKSSTGLVDFIKTLMNPPVPTPNHLCSIIMITKQLGDSNTLLTDHSML